MAKTKKSTLHVCSECLGEFEPKQIFIAAKPNIRFGIEYSTLYCEPCLKKLEITESYPYQKTIVKKVPVKKPTVKNAKKATVKKLTVPKKPSIKKTIKKK